MPSDLLSLLSSILAPPPAAKGAPVPAEGQGAAFADLLKGLTAPAGTAAETPQAVADTPAAAGVATPVATSGSLAERVRDLIVPPIATPETSEDAVPTPVIADDRQKTAAPVPAENLARPVAVPTADTQDNVSFTATSKAATRTAASSALAQAPVSQAAETPRRTTQPAPEATEAAQAPVVDVPPPVMAPAHAAPATPEVVKVAQTAQALAITAPPRAPHIAAARIKSGPAEAARAPEVESAEDSAKAAVANVVAAPAPMPTVAAAQVVPSTITPSSPPSQKAEAPAIAAPAQDARPATAGIAATAVPDAGTEPVKDMTAPAVQAGAIAIPQASPAVTKTGGADDAAKAPVARKAVKPSAFTLKAFDNAAPAPVAKVATPVAVNETTRFDASASAADSETVPQPASQPEAQTPVQSAAVPADNQTPVTAQTAAAPLQTAAPETTAPAPVLSQVATDTLAALSVSVAKRLNDGTTKFTLELHPADFGKVEVSLVIGKDGKVAAHLSFDSAATATAFHARESELRQQLAQAGLDVAGDALSFQARDDAAKGDAPKTDTATAQNGQSLPFDSQRDASAHSRAHNRRAARALADSASAAEDTDLDAHLARLRRPASRLALDLTV